MILPYRERGFAQLLPGRAPLVSNGLMPPFAGTVLFQPFIGASPAYAKSIVIQALATLTNDGTLTTSSGGSVANSGTFINNNIFNQ